MRARAHSLCVSFLPATATAEFGLNISLFPASVETQLANAIRGLRIEIGKQEERGASLRHDRAGEIRSE
jgi:hypothetical protein